MGLGEGEGHACSALEVAAKQLPAAGPRVPPAFFFAYRFDEWPVAGHRPRNRH